jgi:hypothetical protein
MNRDSVLDRAYNNLIYRAWRRRPLSWFVLNCIGPSRFGEARGVRAVRNRLRELVQRRPEAFVTDCDGKDRR